MRVKRHVEDLKQLGLQPEEIVEMPEVSTKRLGGRLCESAIRSLNFRHQATKMYYPNQYISSTFSPQAKHPCNPRNGWLRRPVLVKEVKVHPCTFGQGCEREFNSPFSLENHLNKVLGIIKSLSHMNEIWLILQGN